METTVHAIPNTTKRLPRTIIKIKYHDKPPPESAGAVVLVVVGGIASALATVVDTVLLLDCAFTGILVIRIQNSKTRNEWMHSR